MNPRDEQIRKLITDTLAHSNIDACSCAVEHPENSIPLKGTVSSADKERAVRSALAGLPDLNRGPAGRVSRHLRRPQVFVHNAPRRIPRTRAVTSIANDSVTS